MKLVAVTIFLLSVVFTTFADEAPRAKLTGTLSMATADGSKPAKDFLIWVKIPGHEPSRKPRVEKMNQKDKEFVPRVMIAPTNTEVYFPNLDQIYHSIFSYNKVKKMDLGQYKGKGEPIKFEQPGVYPIGCEIHPWMSAFVVIVDTPFYAKTGLNGNFRMKDLVPGTYTFHIWSDTLKEEVTLEHEIKAGNNTLDWTAGLELQKKKRKKRKKKKKKAKYLKYY